MAKSSINDGIYDRATKAASKAGYSSVDEFINHCVEAELTRLQEDDAESQVADQLRGLGYIE